MLGVHRASFLQSGAAKAADGRGQLRLRYQSYRGPGRSVERRGRVGSAAGARVRQLSRRADRGQTLFRQGGDLPRDAAAAVSLLIPPPLTEVVSDAFR